jgi:TonB family protein
MMKWLAAAVLAAAGTAWAEAPQKSADANIVTDPIWLQRPPDTAYAQYRPKSFNGAGSAAISCTITAEGALSDCKVTDEDPPGAGFGEAALRMSTLFRMRPRSFSHARVAGGTFVTRIRFPASEPADLPGVHSAVITNPDWVRKPGAEEFARFYPKKALETGTSGLATLQCSVTAAGKLSGCVALDESPEGQGFGEAAVKMGQFFQMKPMTLDGRPVAGGMFATRIRFQMGLRAPDWIRRPTQEELQEAWPEQARGAPGIAMLSCELTAQGQPIRCEVKSETPPNLGFGAAALKVAPLARLTPDPAFTAYGVKITIPISFQLPATRQRGVASFGSSLAALTSAPWKTAPTAADMAAAWPAAAPATLQFARVRLRCGFLAAGGLGPCEVLSEDPPGLGFGAAALALTAKFSVRNATDGTAPQAQVKVILPFTFINPKVGGQSPDRISQFNWVTYIDPDSMTALYPAKAADAAIKTGRAVVDCTVAPGGTLADCKVVSEDPPGMEFGPAALEALSRFTINPWTEDGRPVDGAKVEVPIRMNEAEQDAPAPVKDPAPPAKPGG